MNTHMNNTHTHTCVRMHTQDHDPLPPLVSLPAASRHPPSRHQLEDLLLCAASTASQAGVLGLDAEQQLQQRQQQQQQQEGGPPTCGSEAPPPSCSDNQQQEQRQPPAGPPCSTAGNGPSYCGQVSAQGDFIHPLMQLLLARPATAYVLEPSAQV